MENARRRVSVSTGSPVWNSFFTVAPLVLVGTREEGGGYDLAPKHMAMQLGWANFYCFACSPLHATQHNAERTGEFTVSYPRPSQVVHTSLAAGARVEDGSKPGLHALSTCSASAVDGVLVEGAYLWLECKLDRTLEGFGDNSLIIGRIVAASVDEAALRRPEASESGDPVADVPLLAYVNPGRFAEVGTSEPFPFRPDFSI